MTDGQLLAFVLLIQAAVSMLLIGLLRERLESILLICAEILKIVSSAKSQRTKNGMRSDQAPSRTPGFTGYGETISGAPVGDCGGNSDISPADIRPTPNSALRG